MKYTTLCMVVYCMLAAKIFCMENQKEYSLSLQASNQLKHFYNNDFTPQQLYKESDIQDLESFSRIIQNRTQESHDANNKIKKASLLKELSDIIIEQKNTIYDLTALEPRMTRALRHGIVTKKDMDNTVYAMKFLHTKKDGVTNVLTILYKMFEIA